MAGLAVEFHDGAVVQAVRFLRAYWLLLLPLAVVLRFFYYRYASPLRLYPGPFLASGSRAWKVWSTYSGKTETDHIHLHEKYGKPTFPALRFLDVRLTLDFQVRSFASLPMSYHSHLHTLPARSSPPAKDFTRQTSTPSSHPQRTRTSSPRPTSKLTDSRNDTLPTPTRWHQCRAWAATSKTRRGCL
jgi:hypothetical protein